MKKPRIVTSGNKRESSWLRKAFWNLIGPIIVGLLAGLLAIAGQLYVNPIAAKRVMIQESITQKRYEATEKAIELLQRTLASASITGKDVSPEYEPPEKNPPSQLEMQSAYTQLVIYNKSQALAEQFFAATWPGTIKQQDILTFVSTVRKELGVDDKDLTKFQLILIHPVGEDGPQDEAPK